MALRASQLDATASNEISNNNNSVSVNPREYVNLVPENFTYQYN